MLSATATSVNTKTSMKTSAVIKTCNGDKDGASCSGSLCPRTPNRPQATVRMVRKNRPFGGCEFGTGIDHVRLPAGFADDVTLPAGTSKNVYESVTVFTSSGSFLSSTKTTGISRTSCGANVCCLKQKQSSFFT